jgi:transaldolase
MARFKAAGVDLTDLARRLQEAGVESFAAAWKSLLARIEQTAGAAVAR